MKNQYVLVLASMLCGLFVPVNGMHFKQRGDKTIFQSEITSNSTQNQEYLQNTLPICDMDMFEEGERIGRGAIGSIYNIKRKEDSKIFAIKRNYQNMSREIEAMTRIRGLGIAPDILCAGKDHEYFIMEKVNGFTLFNAFSNFRTAPKPKRVSLFQTYAIKMFSILKEIHKLNIYHQDAHWSNWMVENDGLKTFLIDFGGSSINPQNEDTRRFGYNMDIMSTAWSLYNFATYNIGLTKDDMPSPFVSLLESDTSYFDYNKKESPTLDEVLAMFKSYSLKTQIQ